MFNIFPGTFTHEGSKVPIKEMEGWKDKATNDQEIINNWHKKYGHKIKFWGIPTGVKNGIIALDVDVKNGENGFETLKKYEVPKTLTHTTPSGGKHYIFKYPNNGKVYGNKVKFDTGLDIRGEGGSIAFYGLSNNLPIAEAPQWLLDVSEKSVLRVDSESVPPIDIEIINKILEDACEKIREAPQGESNNTLNTQSYRVGQLLPSNCISKDKAFDMLYNAAIYRGKPEYEATATINSGLKGGSQNPLTCPFENIPPELKIIVDDQEKQERWTPPFFSTSELFDFEKLKKPQLFKNWSTEDIHVTTADGGTGKTTLKLFEAICLALGENFLGFECTSPGRTLYITGEDTREKIGAMIGQMIKQMGISDDKEKVRKITNSIVVKKDGDLALITRGRDGFIKVNSEAIDKLSQAIEDLKPRMIVFDPISSFWVSESALNDMSKAVAKFMGVLVEKSNACVEVINHLGKESSNSKDMGQFSGRGGTGLPSHARVSKALRPVFEDEFLSITGQELEENQKAIMCNVNKFTDGSPLWNKPFLIIREGYLFSKLEIVDQKEREEKKKENNVERVFNFINSERVEKRYPSKKLIIAHFASMGNSISKDKVSMALEILQYMGFKGNKIKMIDNPDPESSDKCYIITDQQGNSC